MQADLPLDAGSFLGQQLDFFEVLFPSLMVKHNEEASS